MEILRLTIDDIEKYKDNIASMLKQSFSKSFPVETFEVSTFYDRVKTLKEYMVEEKAIVYGSIRDGNLAGFVWFFVKGEPNKKTVHINHFVVDEYYRSQGIGGTLWNSVETYANQEKIKYIDLFVTNNNEAAVNFYLKRNFEVERLVMKKRL